MKFNHLRRIHTHLGLFLGIISSTSAIAAPEIEIEQSAVPFVLDGFTTVPFGATPVGTPVTRTFTIRNLGSSDLSGISVAPGGAHASEFVLTASPAPTVIGGATTTFTVTFTPGTLGSRIASLQVRSNDDDEGIFDINLAGAGGNGYRFPELLYYRVDGTGTTAPNLASAPVGANPSPIEGAMTQGGTGQFGGGLVGTGGSSAADRLNTGWATNFPQSWTLSLYTRSIPGGSTPYYFCGDSSGKNFRCFSNGIAGVGNVLLRGAGITDVTIPNGATPEAKVVHFAYDGTTREIRGYLNGVLVTTVSQLAQFTVTGNGPFLVGGQGTNAGLPAGGILDEFRLYDRALSATEIAATWADNAFGPAPEIVVEQPMGTGLADGVSSVNAGAVTLGQNSISTFTVKNSGTSDLVGLSIIKEGAQSGDFTVSPLGATVLAPNASTTFSVIFAPSARGNRTAAIRIASNDSDENTFDISHSGTGLSRLEGWRVTHFGSPANSGPGADSNDFEFDGLPNVSEFALGTNPKQPSRFTEALVQVGANLEYTYTRAKAAVLDGFTFHVAWKDDLASPTPWSAEGVTQVVMSDDGTTQLVKATLPAGTAGQRFVHLEITPP